MNKLAIMRIACIWTINIQLQLERENRGSKNLAQHVIFAIFSFIEERDREETI